MIFNQDTFFHLHLSGGLRFCNRVLKMDKMPTNNSSESLSSDTNNDNNVPMLGLLAEQQNQQTNLVVRSVGIGC